jgi:hypothetical protein
MKLAPVNKYPKPNFPTRAILDAHPELLRLIPKRWRNKPAVLGALAWVCLFTAGCGSQQNTHIPHSSRQVTPPIARVAPIFQHGIGRGAEGCIVVNPPVLLSEAEAKQVIIEEAKRTGIDLSASGITVHNVNLPVDFIYFDGKKTKSHPEIKKLNLILDGADKKRHISFEYVSSKDLVEWDDAGFYGSVFEYNTLATAKHLQQSLQKVSPHEVIGVFYDPLVKMDFGKLKASQNPLQVFEPQEKEALRAQVRDFVKWLKAQGVI